MARLFYSSPEPLEARIAPAGLAVYHPLLDLTPSHGQTGANLDLASAFDSDPLAGYRTHVVFTTNFDTDPGTPGLQAGQIVLELFDEKAPLTVQNFLTYLGSGNGHGGYVGTYFHRVVNDPGLQVLQGGGFKADAPTSEIQTGLPVHNEYDPADAERANTEGTIALAKQANAPNSGSDQFFFNLGDNSQTLNGTNDGGFTVFGKIISGLSVARSIAGLPATEVLHGSSPTATPYQNGYQTDPDGNASTPAPAPTADQLVEITSAQIVPAKNSTVAGLHYAVVSITDVSTGAASRMVTGGISGDRLLLHYAPGASGIAEVKVLATDRAGNSATETFHVNLTPNLVAGSAVDGFLSSLQSGDTATETVKLINTGAGTSHGFVTVDYYLSAITSSDPNGTTVDASDIHVGSFTSARAISLASGKSALISGKVQLQSADAQNLIDGTSYRLIGRLSSSGDQTHSDLYTDDNGVIAGVHQFFRRTSLQSDLTVTQVTDNLNPLLVPGDTGLAQATIANVSSTTAAGKVDVQFYLSSDASTAFAPIADVLIGSVSAVSVAVAGGHGLKVQAPVTIPASLDLTSGFYHVHAVVTPSASGGVTELQSANDGGLSTSNHLLLEEFGTLQYGKTVRRGAVLKYTDEASHVVSLHLTGPGNGAAVHEPGGGVGIFVEGTTAASAVALSLAAADGSALGAGVHTIVDDVQVSTQSGRLLGTLAFGQADWAKTVDLEGGVNRLVLGNTSGSGDHFLNLGTPATGAAARPVLTLGALQNATLTSTEPILSLTTGPWLSGDGHEQALSAPALGSFHVKGDLAADVTITPATATGAVALRTLVVDGALTGSTVTVRGSVGSVTLGAMEESDFLVGATFVAQAVSDFNGRYSLGSFRVTGGDGVTTFGVAGSHVVADRIGTLALSSVDPENGGVSFGVVAETIASYRRGAVMKQGLSFQSTPTGVFDADGDYSVRLLNPAS